MAGFWKRLLAAAIDTAVILPISILLSWIGGSILNLHLPPSRFRSLDTWLDLLIVGDPVLVGTIGLAVAIAMVYLFVFQSTLGRTPGMRALKIRIIDGYGDKPSMERAAARTLGYLVATATLGIGFLWVGFDAEKRGLHDWISNTYVVKA